MKESLTSRVGRIISGSFNAIVGMAENAMPETVMEEAIREIDGAVDDVRTELGSILARKHIANSRLMAENKRHEELSDQIGLAVKEGKDNLAETAIARQLDIEAQIPVLEESIGKWGQQEKELEGYIQALQAKKREMQQELNAFRESRRAALVTDSAEGAAQGTASTTAGKVSKAESTFERVMSRASGVMASTTSAADRKSAVELAELEELSRKNRIQERLAVVKKELEQRS